MRRMILRLLAVLSAVVLLAAGSAGALEGLTEMQDNFFVSPDPAYEKLVDRVQKASHRNSYIGSVLLATDEAVILYGGPRAMTTNGRPADLHTTYDIGSCSKVFTAVAVFQLVEAGLISLDDPVTKYFPAYEAGRDITVRHLLHMQSGIADYVNEPPAFWVKVDPAEMDAFLVRFYRDEVPDGELLENLYAAPLLFVPGTEQRYCNTNYHLLALIVEQVSGQRLCDYLEEHVFRVCGMEHTTAMAIGDETSVPRLFGELLEAGIVNENGYSFSPLQERGAGGIHTCMADLWAFDRALVSGQLVSSASLEEMTRFEMDYGCGLYPYEKNSFGHSGRNGTYTTQNVIIMSKKYGRIYFIASTATDAGTYGLAALMQAVFSQLGTD